MGIYYEEIESNAVGFKDDFEMHSIDFEEFLWAKGYSREQVEDLYQHMITLQPFSQLEMDTMMDLFRDYMTLGGMPEVVKMYIDNGHFEGTLKLQRQLLKGYDFVYLNEHKNCLMQMGGSDQWGNITTGTELIKKITGNEAFALTCPLITKADGGKFGKTESGNIWLSRKYTSPYKFYQFWMNVSDDDAKRYIKIFTSLTREEIEALIKEHEEAPHLRVLQKRLAKEVTCMVHSEADYNAAVEASNILFGNATADALRALDEETFLDIFNGVEQYEISLEELKAGIGPLDLLAEKTNIFTSKGEARKMIQANGFSLNKEKLTDPQTPLTDAALLNNKYLLFQKGKKNYYLVIAK